MKKQILIPKESLKEKPIYCTECGEQLENFCFSEDVDNIETVRKQHEKCKNSDRFKGDQCSKLFIAQQIEPTDTAGE